VDWKYWGAVMSVFVGGVSLVVGTFVSSTCSRYGPGENGCIEYGYDLLGRGITVAGLALVITGLYVIFTPYVGWPFVARRP
jgi:dipeptide/tripeptide permease